MGKAGILGIALALASYDQVNAQEDVPRRINQADKIAVMQAVRARLRDPESAKFKWTKVVSINFVYCGWVNSKNGYGGYGGFEPFAVMLVNMVNRETGKFVPIATVSNMIGDDKDLTPDILIGVCQKFGSDIADGPPSD